MEPDFDLGAALTGHNGVSDQVKPIGDFALTQMGLAERFAAQHGENVRYCHSLGWVVWDGRRWAQDSTGEIKRKAKTTVRSIYVEAAMEQDINKRKQLADLAKRAEARHNLEAMIALAQSELPIPVLSEIFDTNSMLLNVLNGTLNLTTGQLQPHKRSDYITKLASVVYDPDATCLTWDAFLDQIMDGNKNLIDFMQRLLGYSLTGSTEEHCFGVMHGNGANGKTTLADTICWIFGDYAQTSAFTTFLAKKTDSGIPNDIARLRGARLVYATEGEQGRALAESAIKQLTGGDRIAARFLHREFFEFRPTFKILLGTNHKPRIKGTDLAIWRRIKLIPFAVTIPEDRQDRKLPEKLRVEAPGILAWAVRGCLDWQRDGLGIPDEVRTATQAYRQEEDIVGQFIAEGCVIKTSVKVAAKAIFEAYQRWCQENGEKPVTQNAFGAALSERGLIRKRGTGGAYWWLGVGLLSEPLNLSDPKNDLFVYEIDSREISGKEVNKGSLTAKGSLLNGCDFYRTTGDCRAAHEIELMALPVKSGLEGLGCRSFQTSGRCPAADSIEALMESANA